jgi:hypothetical protein
MKIKIGTPCKTKRGHTYNARHTRVANGFSKVLADSKKRYPLEINDPKYSVLLKLAVQGTTDTLHGIRFRTMWVIVPHPQDPSYTKKVLRLNETGKYRLRHLRRAAINKEAA